VGSRAWRLLCRVGTFGAYEFTDRLEGEVTYLVLAAPLITVTAGLIPPIARNYLAKRTPSQGPSLSTALVPRRMLQVVHVVTPWA
jgi:hypothetical protein